jgi:hypothetical protein
MPTRLVALLAVLAVSAPAAQQAASPIAELRTRAESSNYEETSTYADIERYLATLATSPLVHVETFGKSEEGRDLPLVAIADPKVASPEAARKLGRPIVFVQANIHAGEVEGKEAILGLARRLADGDLKPLTRQLVILIAPDYNADGNEKVNVMNRTAQNGPVGGVGTRENAKGLDLNRDYMKLDSAEARALVGLMNRWDPHVLVDLHTTNGSYHGFHLTYSPTLNPNADPRLIAFERDRLLPAVREAVRKKHNFRTYYYGNFAPEGGGGRESSRVDPASPGNTTWRTFDHRPRFGNNYAGLRNRIAILSEAYSYLDFKGRIDVTAAFVEEIFRASAANARSILTVTSQADQALTAAAAAAKPKELGVDIQIQALPQLVDILVGDVTRLLNPRSGREMLQMTDEAVPVKMKDYGVFAAARSVPFPQGWVIPRAHAQHARMSAALDRLRWHGVRLEPVAAAAQLPVERFVVDTLVRAERPFQGHREARLKGRLERAQLSVEPGSIFVPARQPLARLAFYLLEAESDDGLVTWNLIEEGLTAGEAYPVYRVLDAGGVK